MARVWRRDGVKGAWMRAALWMCAAMVVCVWVFAPYAIFFNLGTAALIVWEVPTLAACYGLVRMRQWQAQMWPRYMAANPQATGVATQKPIPGLDDPPDEEGAWQACSLHPEEHG